MVVKQVKVPDASHPITVTANPNRVVVTVGGTVVADTHAALTLHESTYPGAQYIPRADVDLTLLERSATSSYCPYKGEASYFSIPAGGPRSTDAIWTYESPYDAVRAIKDHVAFSLDRIDSMEQFPA